jgi:hypothetical protein
MRIPLYIYLPLCILTLLLTWWVTTRKIDFLTPPSEAELAMIREDALASLPVSRTQQSNRPVINNNTPTDPNNPDSTENLEPIEVGDLSAPKTLDTYSEWAPDGAGKLLRLAKELELKGAFQRSLLAYERVLDLSQATPEEIQTALLAIRRIRPTLTLWNENPALRHQVVINIGTGQKFADLLPKIMDKLTQDLRRASSGQIQFSYKLNIGRSIQATGAPTPVAIWMTGTDPKNPSTDVLSFTTNNPETLRNDIMKTVFNLVRGQLAKATSYNPAPEAVDDVQMALFSNITRLLWDEFGKNLNPKPKEP